MYWKFLPTELERARARASCVVSARKMARATLKSARRGVRPAGAAQLHIGRRAAGPEAEVKAPLGQVVQEGDPAGDMTRVVLVEADGGRAQADAVRFPQGTADEDLRHHDGLVLHRVMLADPELAEAQLLGADDQLEILAEA